MIEDDFYRSSSQYRLWSFTRESLNSIRANTNAIASERVRAAQRRAKAAVQSNTPSATGTPTPTPSDAEGKPEAGSEKEVECLTPEEELELVQYYCEQTLELGGMYKEPLPTTVRVRSALFSEDIALPYYDSLLQESPMLIAISRQRQSSTSAASTSRTRS